MTKIAIIIMGPQGSGKGTQGKILAEKHHLYRFDMGSILRDEIKNNTHYAQKISRYIDNGIYLPDNFLIEILDEKLEDISKANSMIFDGVPRKPKQAKYLINYLNQHGFKKIITIRIYIPADETMKRLLKRAKIEKRKDDTPEKIKARLEQNISETLPILGFLKKESTFYEVDGLGEVDTVSARIEAAIKKDINEE